MVGGSCSPFLKGIFARRKKLSGTGRCGGRARKGGSEGFAPPHIPHRRSDSSRDSCGRGMRMCTMIATQIQIDGSGKGVNGWFRLREATVSYDHPFDAPFEHALNLDFVNEALGPDARVAVELSPQAARPGPGNQRRAGTGRGQRVPVAAGSRRVAPGRTHRKRRGRRRARCAVVNRPSVAPRGRGPCAAHHRDREREGVPAGEHGSPTRAARSGRRSREPGELPGAAAPMV